MSNNQELEGNYRMCEENLGHVVTEQPYLECIEDSQLDLKLSKDEPFDFEFVNQNTQSITKYGYVSAETDYFESIYKNNTNPFEKIQPGIVDFFQVRRQTFGNNLVPFYQSSVNHAYNTPNNAQKENYPNYSIKNTPATQATNILTKSTYRSEVLETMGQKIRPVLTPKKTQEKVQIDQANRTNVVYGKRVAVLPPCNSKRNQFEQIMQEHSSSVEDKIEWESLKDNSLQHDDESVDKNWDYNFKGVHKNSDKKKEKTSVKKGLNKNKIVLSKRIFKNKNECPANDYSMPVTIKKENYYASSKNINKKTKRKGCTCKRSKCVKNYCECYQSGLACFELCSCYECCNTGLKQTNGQFCERESGLAIQIVGHNMNSLDEVKRNQNENFSYKSCQSYNSSNSGVASESMEQESLENKRNCDKYHKNSEDFKIRFKETNALFLMQNLKKKITDQIKLKKLEKARSKDISDQQIEDDYSDETNSSELNSLLAYSPSKGHSKSTKRSNDMTPIKRNCLNSGSPSRLETTDKKNNFFFNTKEYFGSNTTFMNKKNIDIGKESYDIKSIKLNYFNSQHY